MKVLVVDDDVDLLDLVTYALRREGFTVIPAIDGIQALHYWENEQPDIVLLDGNLPKLNGFEVCRRIRQESEIPIIMLSARDDEEDVIRGLHLGADDYVTKPFSAKQLVARMKAVLRRAQIDRNQQPVNELQIGDLLLDFHAHETVKAGVRMHLTPIEFKILFMLAMNENRLIPSSRIVEYAWGYDRGDANLLKTHVCHLREKLDWPIAGEHGIKAVPGLGYKLVLGCGA